VWKSADHTAICTSAQAAIMQNALISVHLQLHKLLKIMDFFFD